MAPQVITSPSRTSQAGAPRPRDIDRGHDDDPLGRLDALQRRTGCAASGIPWTARCGRCLQEIVVTWCTARFEMDLVYCEHRLAACRDEAIANAERLPISRNGIAYFPGCPHKDDDDCDGWPYSISRAWEAPRQR
jgi:hypothetical protein